MIVEAILFMILVLLILVYLSLREDRRYREALEDIIKTYEKLFHNQGLS